MPNSYGFYTIKEICRIFKREPDDIYQENKWWCLVFNFWGSSNRIDFLDKRPILTPKSITVKIRNF